MENINYRYQRQMEAEGGARLQETLCVGEQNFSPELRHKSAARALTPTQGGQQRGSINLIGTGIISGYHSLKG